MPSNLRVSIILPIVRKDRASECIEAIKKNAGISWDQYEIVSSYDEDRIGCPKMVKKLTALAKADLVMFLGDDTLPREDFLLRALNAMKMLPDGWGMVGLNDLTTDGNVYATHWLASKKLLPLIGGEFFHTGYVHTHCDLELTIRCKLLGRYIWSRESSIDHIHPMQEPGVFDKDYERSYSVNAQIVDRNLFERRMAKINSQTNTWKLKKIPKILHLYWGRNKKLSFMRYMTAYSFWKFNPDWKIKVHYPKYPYAGDDWDSEHQKSYNFRGDDHFDRLRDIPTVEMVEVEFEGMEYNAPEVIRSDLYRLTLLEKEGGFWSDFDILYIKPMTKMIQNLELNSDVDTLICSHHGFNRIGFLGGAPGNKGFYHSLRNLYDYYQSRDLYELDGYQGAGRFLFDSYFLYTPRGKDIMLAENGINILNIPINVVYPTLANKVHRIFSTDFLIHRDSIGIHWYAGSGSVSKFENVMDEEVINTYGEFLFFSIMKSIYLSGDLKYSILIPYHERADQLYNTLISYQYHYSERNDYEIIIVEDFKNYNNELERNKLLDVIDHFNDSLNIVHITSEVKNNYNPAPLFNEAAKASRGKFLVLTNPECFHEVDILTGYDGVFDFNDDVYIISGCKNVGSYPRRVDKFENFDYVKISWYQHSEERNSGLHFCSGMSRFNFDIIGGFDEGFSKGVDFDDTDFRERVRESRISIMTRDDLVVAHQKHSKNESVFSENLPDNPLYMVNKRRFYRKRRMDFRLGIGIPHTEKTMWPYFFDSFVTMDKPEFIYMRPPFTGYVGVDVARNSLVAQALENGCSHLLMMDTDQMYPQDTITKLISHNRDMVGAKIHRRYPPFDPIMLRGEHGALLRIPDEECFSGELVEVDATGCGCVLYDMEVFIKIRPPWFEIYQLEDGKDVGEDIGFCAKLRDAGFRVFVDTSIEINHMATIGVNRSFYEIYGKIDGSKRKVA